MTPAQTKVAVGSRLCYWQLLLVIALASLLVLYKLGDWPWDHDEVPSLVELGLLAVDGQAGQTSQLQRLPKLLPVWYGTQYLFLTVFPHNELGTRILSALCGVVTLAFVFLFARRWRGMAFAVALAMLIGLNQCFIWLVQQNRFYSMALLFLTLSFATMWWQTQRRALAMGLCSIVTLLAVLSHNLLVVVFGIASVASLCCFVLGAVSKDVLLRSGVAAGIAALTYLLYLRPIMSGWVSGGTGGTNELVSFSAQIGPPTIALTVLGFGMSITGKFASSELLWWSLVLAGGMLFVGLSPWILGNWNPRYAVFFMPPFCVLAAIAIEHVAYCLPNPQVRILWYICIAMLLVPKLASHYCDGSRHDFRTSARLVAGVTHVHEPILTNWPMTLQYYLDQIKPAHVDYWERNNALPEQTCLVIYASNAFEPTLAIQHRRCDVLGEVGVRRFDEQSHLIRIYRIWSASAPN